MSQLHGSNFYFKFRKDQKRQYEFFDDKGKVRKIRRDRENPQNADRPTGGRGGRGGRRPPREEGKTEKVATEPVKQ